jgi:transposase-like protein
LTKHGATGADIPAAVEKHVVANHFAPEDSIVSCDTTSRLRDRSRRRLKPIRTRQSQYLNNRIEQDHRSIKRRVRPMLGFKSADSARTILGGIEMIAMMRKRQARYAFNPRPSLAEQFDILAA